MTAHDHLRLFALTLGAGCATPEVQRDAAPILLRYVDRAEAVECDRIVLAAQEDAEQAERRARLNVVRLHPRVVRSWPDGVA